MANYSLAYLAQMTGATLVGNPDHLISGVEDLSAASSSEAAFFENSRYQKDFERSQAGVICIQPDLPLIPQRNYLLHPHPSLIFQTLIELFIPLSSSGFLGIHPSAVIHPEAKLGEHVEIGPHVVIDRGVVIGDRTRLEAGVTIGADSSIGSDCHFYSHVTIREGCQIGHRVVLQPGAVIGSCGFGFFSDPKTGQHISLKQLGKVVIEDDVEIGANTTIDRARFKQTTIRKGTKIDNLVQIAHQVDLGPNNLIVSQVGIAGSTKTGRNVVMGGQVGVIGHIEIGDGVILAARAAVSKGLKGPGVYSGAPAAPIKEFNRQFIQLRTLSKWVDRLKELEAKAQAFEKLLEGYSDDPSS